MMKNSEISLVFDSHLQILKYLTEEHLIEALKNCSSNFDFSESLISYLDGLPNEEVFFFFFFFFFFFKKKKIL